MQRDAASTEKVLARLVDELDQVRPDLLAKTAVDELVNAGIVEQAVLWILDHGEDFLSDLSGISSTLSVEGTPAGLAALSDTPHLEDGRAFLPLSRRGQVIGVLEVSPMTPETVGDLLPLVKSLTNSVLATVPISDVVDRHQRSGALSLPATIQRRNLPLVSYADDQIEVGGRLEPAYDVAGDAIDYAVNPEGIHFAIFDAVGHGLRSTTLSTLALSTYRLLRRQGATLADTAAAIDEVIASNGQTGEFVTGILATIRPDQATMEIWNAGHHPPLLIREGNYEFLSTYPAGLPFGLRNSGDGYGAFESRRDDVIFLYSDGVVQARDPNKMMWGEITFAHAAMRHAASGISMNLTCRRLLDAVIDWTVDPLTDDASVVGLRRLAS